jgi:hypothetical protein
MYDDDRTTQSIDVVKGGSYLVASSVLLAAWTVYVLLLRVATADMPIDLRILSYIQMFIMFVVGCRFAFKALKFLKH